MIRPLRYRDLTYPFGTLNSTTFTSWLCKSSRVILRPVSIRPLPSVSPSGVRSDSEIAAPGFFQQHLKESNHRLWNTFEWVERQGRVQMLVH